MENSQLPNSQERPKAKGKLNWAIFLFFGSLIWGGFYASYIHGFLQYDRDRDYRLDAGQPYIIPQILLVPARSDEAIENGAQVYQRVCIACHGSYGQYAAGMIGPDLSDGSWLHSSNEKAMNRLILKGISAAQSISGQVMPARAGVGLSEREIWEVIYFLSSRNNSIQQDSEPTE